MAVIATLTPTPVPAGDTSGSCPMKLYHVQVTSAGGAGTYKFPHGLSYTPTIAWAINNAAEGVNPSTSNLGQVAFCSADTDGTNIGINLAGNGMYDIIFG